MRMIKHLLLAPLILATATEASLLRRSGNLKKQQSVRHRKRQLFSGRNALTQDVDVERSLHKMAGDIHDLLEQTLSEKRNGQSSKVSLTDDVSGVRVDRGYGQCTLQGKVMFTTQKVQGLDSFHADSLELVHGSEDYQEIKDSRGRLQGYQWHGVWKIVATVDPFQVGVTSQVDVNACGTPLDFTAFGGVAVNRTTIEATVRVEGELSKDLSEARLQIESAEVLSQQLEFDSISHVGGLTSKLPLDYEGELRSLVEFLFARKLEQPVLRESETER